jgi:hypothetical protein
MRVGMSVQVEVAMPPADEQPQGEEDDHRGNGRLGALLQTPRQVALGEEDREAEDHERQRVPEPPPRSEPSGRARGPLSAGGDQRRDGGDVVRIRRVAQSQEGRHEEDDGDRRAVREPRDPVVESEHVPCSSSVAQRFGVLG